MLDVLAPPASHLRAHRALSKIGGSSGCGALVPHQFRLHGWDPAQVFGPAPLIASIEFQCWLDPERMIAALEQELERLPHAADALPLDQRASRLAELEA